MDRHLESDVARRDRAVPGLGTVFDPPAFLEALRRVAPHADIRSGSIRYLRYKPHVLCRVSYRVDIGGTEVDLDVRACRPDDLAELMEEYRADAVLTGPLGPGRIVLEPEAVLVTVFPNDLKLHVLRDFADPERRRPVISDLLPDRSALWSGDLHRLSYRPERRFVAELRANGNGDGIQRAVVKSYTRKAYQRGKHHAEIFESSGALQVARLIGWSDGNRLLAFEWLPGRTLFDHVVAVPAPAELDGGLVGATGAALATLHDQVAEGLNPWTRQDEIDALGVLAAEVGSILPRLGPRVRALAQRIGDVLQQAPPIFLPMHGDFSSTQVLVAPPHVAIIDLDWACLGDPGEDLGCLLAQTERAALNGERSWSWVEAFRDALLDGYRRGTRRSVPDRIDVYTARGLFRRARNPFRTREPDWPERTEALIARAEAIVGLSP